MHRVKFWKSPLGWVVGLRPARSHRVKFGAGAPADQIEFKLGKGAVQRGFHFDTEDPIWVSEDNGNCPPPSSTHSQIVDVCCAADRVTVTDRNSGDPVTLRYQLNVLDSGNRPVPIDPIIENGGGGIE